MQQSIHHRPGAKLWLMQLTVHFEERSTSVEYRTCIYSKQATAEFSSSYGIVYKTINTCSTVRTLARWHGYLH